MNVQKSGVVLRFPERRLQVEALAVVGAATEESLRTSVRRPVTRDRGVRFFQEIHGAVYSGRQVPPDYGVVVCAGRGNARAR